MAIHGLMSGLKMDGKSSFWVGGTRDVGMGVALDERG